MNRIPMIFINQSFIRTEGVIIALIHQKEVKLNIALYKSLIVVDSTITVEKER